MRDGDGSPRVRIGLIIPATNTTAEPDFVRALPAHVTVHSSRIWLPESSVTAEALDDMNKHIEVATRHLTEAGVDAIVYGSTAGSFYRGEKFGTSLQERIESIAGIPAVITATAVVQALRHLDGQSVAVATPYNAWENARLQEFLSQNGIGVIRIEGDPDGAAHGGRGHSNLSPASAFAFAQSVWDERADLLFCACTAWRTLEIAADLEDHIGRPVVTANQASLWAVSKLLSIRLTPGLGALTDGVGAE